MRNEPRPTRHWNYRSTQSRGGQNDTRSNRPNDRYTYRTQYSYSFSTTSHGYCMPATETKEPKQRFKPRFKPLNAIILSLLLAGFLYAAYQIVYYCIQTTNARHAENNIVELIAGAEASAAEVTVIPTINQNSAAVVSPAPTATPSIVAAAAVSGNTPQQTTEPEVLIQFNNALAINPDTVGQLHMGESINTYVVQRDNSYYLRHSFYDEYSISGAIFLDVSCSICPQSRNLILHGHNMQNGTAFGKLLRFKSLDYRNEYPVIHFDTLYQTADYTPFAAVYYSIDPESEDYLNIYQVNYLSDDAFISFIQTVKSRSLYHLYISVSAADKILTITTCTNEDSNMRFAVFAVEI